MSFECFLLNVLFRFTGKGRYHLYWLLGEPSPHSVVGKCQVFSWMMMPPSQHIDISSLDVTTATVPTEEEDGGGAMFVLYVRACSPIFDKHCALQRDSKKKLFTEGKGRENIYQETQFYRVECGGTTPNADISALM